MVLSLHFEIVLSLIYSPTKYYIMKKLFLGLACVIGLMFFASCTQEVIDDIMAQKPSVEFISGEGLIAGNTSVYVGTELNFQVKVAPNSGSQSELSHFDFSITDLTGATVFNENPAFDDPNGENIFYFSYTPSAASTYAVTATVTDKAGKVNVITAVVDYVEPVVEGIGTFNGILTINGHVTTNEVVGYTYDDDYNIEDLDVTITLGTIDENNRVSATIDIDGTPVTLYGTMVENTITFDEFHFNKTITITATVTLDLAMNITGVLEDDVMTLSGTAAGSGKTQVLLIMLEANYEGNIDGSLERVTE